MEFGNWKIGKYKSTVVSDRKVKNTNFPIPPNQKESRDEEAEYYGGYLICESVANDKHVKLISAAPDLLEALLNIENDNNSIPKAIWEMRNKAIKKATE
ncbi:hypothetical protein [Salinimicrobium sp. GXAS 041]|uniref:hypothetical protein n=1 Tax=Salinimicrobium sp. GXAS 041 TaxID=3400806 RepID=UPI003C7319C1